MENWFENKEKNDDKNIKGEKPENQRERRKEIENRN